MKNLDDILLPGGNIDLETLSFNEEPHPKHGRIIPDKDETNFLILA